MTADLTAELGRGVGLARALEIFDALPAVAVEELSGRWAGTEVPTGSPLDGLLGAYGWYGKRFVSAEEVDPLVFGRPGSLFAVNPALLPVGLAVRFPCLARNPVLAAVARQVLSLLRTRRPGARLRMVDHRGASTATMVYDAQPINDHFRRLDGDTLLGVMDLRGLAEPFFFLLRREAPVT
ncbi:DUF4334 domain-containing protein [Corynebacterium hylobatis]|uniref:DUF4334 domain-containing protein n=1 Tax=Corynebacterium hylobatis TaxID=1859290 RepID=A0A430HYW1_9CORY|nr:DUF4334 domain-containing protein [Corynebacterium hylobatis]RSZ63899.1 DUF4334 domain-containing protein [Corynebacterium hylobatis]